jgi:hypothetical protein
MTQFGVGPELAQQCPSTPSPDGYRAWTDADGPVPDELTKRATAFASDTNIPLGSTESYPLPGVTTLIRIEPHAWGRDDKGKLVQGCFRAGAVFLPEGGSTAPEKGGGWDKTVAILTAVSLAVGTAATLYSWGKS